MSEIIDCDPSKGFVAFPVALFDLDLTPGAFRTLAELCRMANTSGQCWPSLAQLGRRLGRSRAAVSGYISELRDLGVLSTQEQKMANGYNYRLRYTVTFWKEWRAGLRKERAAKPAPKPERRVQPSERPLETKNHIHKNQHQLGKFPDLVSEWKKAVGNAPYPSFSSRPSDNLIGMSKSLPNETNRVPPISADIDHALMEFCEEKQLSYSGGIGAEIAPEVNSNAVLTQLIEALKQQWQPHWRNPPNAFQLKRMLKELPPEVDEATEIKLLKSYLRRWNLHLRSLPSAAIRSKVAA